MTKTCQTCKGSGTIEKDDGYMGFVFEAYCPDCTFSEPPLITGEEEADRPDVGLIGTYLKALTQIAIGRHIYGDQALEYKNIARKALGMEVL